MTIILFFEISVMATALQEMTLRYVNAFSPVMNVKKKSIAPLLSHINFTLSSGAMFLFEFLLFVFAVENRCLCLPQLELKFSFLLKM